jgi:hypothetical protein
MLQVFKKEDRILLKKRIASIFVLVDIFHRRIILCAIHLTAMPDE